MCIQSRVVKFICSRSRKLHRRNVESISSIVLFSWYSYIMPAPVYKHHSKATPNASGRLVLVNPDDFQIRVLADSNYTIVLLLLLFHSVMKCVKIFPSSRFTFLFTWENAYVTVWEKPAMFAYKLKFILLPQLIAILNNYACSLPPLTNVAPWTNVDLSAFPECLLPTM